MIMIFCLGFRGYPIFSLFSAYYYYIWEKHHPLASYFRVPIPYLTLKSC